MVAPGLTPQPEARWDCPDSRRGGALLIRARVRASTEGAMWTRESGTKTLGTPAQQVGILTLIATIGAKFCQDELRITPPAPRSCLCRWDTAPSWARSRKPG